MKKKNLSILLVCSIFTMMMSSCTSAEEKKWSYTKEDMSDFISIDADLEGKENDQSTLKTDTDVTLFKEKIDNDDVIVYDIDKVVKTMEEKKKDYADYSILKAASLTVCNVETLSDNDGFNVTFEADDSVTNVGMLVHPSVTCANKYVMVSQAEDDDTMAKDTQGDFEEKYVTSKLSWEDGGKFIFQMVSNLSILLAGVGSENPGAIVTGVFGMLGSLSETFGSKSATIQDVMNQLKETDRKIDELNTKLEKNTQQLADEIVRTEALVDQTNLNTLNLAINDFATNCLAPINTFNRNLSDAVSDYYRSYISSPKTINLALKKGSNGKWSSSSLAEITDSSEYNFSLTINDFANAKNNLSNNNNIVENGFMDELLKDIEAAINAKAELPEGIDKSELSEFVYSMIYEQFMKEYFSTNKTKAQEYRNLVIELAQRISGSSGKVSILDSYLSRLQCMYNFAGEIKSTVRALCANLLKVLDMNTARAAEATYFAQYSTSDLEKDYKTARDAVQNFYKNVKETSDAYSYTTAAVLTGGFYQGQYTATYTNPGNKCTLNVSYSLDKIEMSGTNVSRTKDDMSKHNSISAIQHARIATRWNLLRTLGIADTKNDYINYLKTASVIPSTSIDAMDTLLSLKETGSSCYRILTGNSKERELNSTDSSISLNCVGQGNPEGKYYELGKTYTYLQGNNAASWYGKTYEGTFVDATSGSSLGTGKVATWARYAESHWYWSNDEYWAFTNESKNNYFFLIDIVNQN
jgi:hypothetical protein